jgi:hypothetical protein
MFSAAPPADSARTSCGAVGGGSDSVSSSASAGPSPPADGTYAVETGLAGSDTDTAALVGTVDEVDELAGGALDVSGARLAIAGWERTAAEENSW